MERERERESVRKREKMRDNFGILYSGYLLSILKIKRDIYIERERKREERERERERQKKSVKKRIDN